MPLKSDPSLTSHQFWKQFFESSANVSLSGYEEQIYSQQDDGEQTATEDSHNTTHTTLETSSYETPSAQHISTDSIQDLDLSNMTISPSKSSTPRPSTRQVQPQDQTATFADYPSPYETLREEVNHTTAETTSLNDDQTRTQMPNLPSTPGRQQPTLQPSQIAMTPQSSPFLPPHPQPTSIPRPSTIRKRTDPLLHRVLDRNYRIQATPLTNQKYSLPKPATATPATTSRNRRLFDSTLSSSPAMAPPELHGEIFSSPPRKPRTPGVSVLTPARHRENQNQPVLTPGAKPAARNAYHSDDDDLDDSDLQFDASPPKTMHFHIPQSRLLKTPGTSLHRPLPFLFPIPTQCSCSFRNLRDNANTSQAKEASQRIVDSILETAGMHDYDDDPDNDDQIDLDLDLDGDPRQRYELDLDDGSPSLVRKAVGLEDGTF